MKILYTSLLILLSIFLMSNKSGRGNVTGNGATLAPGETGQTCGQQGCHSSGNFDPVLDIVVKDTGGNPITEYEPGMSYTMEYMVQNDVGVPAGFGFMIVGLDKDNEPVNSWDEDNLPEDTRKVGINGRSYLEHSDRIPGDNIILPWIGPEAGTGKVTFYAASALVNGNGSPSGDNGTNLSFSLQEAGNVSASNIFPETEDIYPNPVRDQLFIDFSQREELQYEILNSQGSTLQQGVLHSTLNTTDLQSGLYFLRIVSQKGESMTQAFIKQ